MLAGKHDALALLGLSSGALSALPYFAGSPFAAPAALTASAAGAGWLGWKEASRRLEKARYQKKRENFVLPSDPSFGDFYGHSGYRLGLTTDFHRPIDLPDQLAWRHMAIIGQSGVGKTVLGENLLWQQTMRGGGWLFIDAKLDRETCQKMAHMARLAGREQDFYVLDSSDPGNSNTYNPILDGSGDEIASRLMNLLPSAENNPGADHYRQSANYALSVIITALQSAGMVYHFGDLAVLLQSPNALKDLERRTRQPEAARALRLLLDQYRIYTKDGPQIDMKRLKDVLGGMAGRIATFAQGDFGAVMNHVNPEISLYDLIQNDKMLYVMLPTMAKDTAALNLGKMIVSDLRSAVAKIQDLPKYERPNPPFLAFLDEMGSYVLYGVKTLFEQARSANIMMIPGFQAFANLSVVTEDFAEIIIQNTWSKALFKSGSSDAEEAAEIIGKAKRFSEGLSESDSEGESAPLLRMTPQQQWNDTFGTGTSYQKTEEYRITPDQIRALNIGECALISGARLFHLKVPMVDFPEQMPPFKAVKRLLEIPASREPAPYASRYMNYLSVREREEGDKEKKTEESKMYTENNAISERLRANREQSMAESES